MTVEKGKFPSQPVPNPKGVYETSTSSPQQHEEVKAVMTLWKGKEVDNKVEMPATKENQIVPVIFQRCMLSIFSDMVERFLEVFMDDFSVFVDSFKQRCIEKYLVLN